MHLWFLCRYRHTCLQFFDAVGWATGRASGHKKLSGEELVWYLSGARSDLHMAQLMPSPLTVSCFSKIQIGFSFWYWLTRVVPDKGPLNGCVCGVYRYTQTTFRNKQRMISWNLYVTHIRWFFNGFSPLMCLSVSMRNMFWISNKAKLLAVSMIKLIILKKFEWSCCVEERIIWSAILTNICLPSVLWYSYFGFREYAVPVVCFYHVSAYFWQHPGYCDMQYWAWTAHLYCSA